MVSDRPAPGLDFRISRHKRGTFLLTRAWKALIRYPDADDTCEKKTSMPRLLHISRNLPPLVGGMERLNYHVINELKNDYVLDIIGPADSQGYFSQIERFVEIRIRPLWLFLLRALIAGIRLSVRQTPDIVFAGSGLLAPVAWIVARLTGAKCVVYVHGLDLVVSHPIYQRVWLPFIRRCDLCIANSKNTARLAETRGVPAEKIQILNPGVSIPVLDVNARDDFRERWQLGERPVLLSVGRLTERKGILEFIQHSLPRVVEKHPDVLLLIIGAEALDAVDTTQGGMRNRLEKLTKAANLTENIRFLGQCDETELSQAYQAADIHVFPIRERAGDVEGFGMVAIEAAAHGLPTIGFRVGGVPDAVSPMNGRLLDEGDYDALTHALLTELSENGIWLEQCREFASQFEWSIFGKRLLSMLNALRPVDKRD